MPTGEGPPGGDLECFMCLQEMASARGDLDWFMCLRDMARPVGIWSGLCTYRRWPARWGFRVFNVPTGDGLPGRDLKCFLCLQERACPVGI